MFQCLGLGTTEDGGCGEDWWHPGCIAGLGPTWYETASRNGTPKKPRNEGLLESITEVAEAAVDEADGETKMEDTTATTNRLGNPTETTEPHDESENEEEDPPVPPGFPHEDDFEGFICYKCVDANPWIKRYAGAPGFLAPVFKRSAAPSPETGLLGKTEELIESHLSKSKKRKADSEESDSSGPSKRVKDVADGAISTEIGAAGKGDIPEISDEKPACKIKLLPSAPTGQLSLFFKSDFRDHLCHCPDCFPDLKRHEHLIEPEETYEPPLSESDDEEGGSTIGSGSIYDRGESALKNVDRVRAIEGVMAYNHLKDKLKPFFQQFAESGQAISAEDVKAHFAKMRGDEQAIKEAGEGAKRDDNRREQSGY